MVTKRPPNWQRYPRGHNYKISWKGNTKKKKKLSSVPKISPVLHSIPLKLS